MRLVYCGELGPAGGVGGGEIFADDFPVGIGSVGVVCDSFGGVPDAFFVFVESVQGFYEFGGQGGWCVGVVGGGRERQDGLLAGDGGEVVEDDAGALVGKAVFPQ